MEDVQNVNVPEEGSPSRCRSRFGGGSHDLQHGSQKCDGTSRCIDHRHGYRYVRAPSFPAPASSSQIRGPIPLTSGKDAQATAATESPDLSRPGPGYSLTVTKDSFQVLEINNLYLPVAVATTQDATLQLGSVSQKVEVTAQGSISLNTTDTTIGNNLDMRAVENLPNEFRDDPAQLLRLQVGVVSAQSPLRRAQLPALSSNVDPNGNSRDGSVAGSQTLTRTISLWMELTPRTIAFGQRLKPRRPCRSRPFRNSRPRWPILRRSTAVGEARRPLSAPRAVQTRGMARHTSSIELPRPKPTTFSITRRMFPAQLRLDPESIRSQPWRPHS